jgi:tRNA pseudouridine38-40 synthase
MGEQVQKRRSQKYRVTLQYVGTRYHGWQIQAGERTVQGTVRTALSTLAGTAVKISGASRTDSGVHALGQVAHFRFPDKDSIPDLGRALNAILPKDIRVVRLQKTAQHFHAQKDARKKRYEYRVYNGKVLSPFLSGRVCHIVHPLNIGEMREGARMVVGRHDFTGFAASSTTVRNRVRTIVLSELVQRGRTIVYRVEADGFLHHMVRNIMGTLLDIGLEKRDSNDILRVFRLADRRQAGATAPPEGLYLVRIWY